LSTCGKDLRNIESVFEKMVKSNLSLLKIEISWIMEINGTKLPNQKLWKRKSKRILNGNSRTD